MKEREDTLGSPGEPENQQEPESANKNKEVPSLMWAIAQRIRHARRAKHLTQEGLAGTEFSHSYISSIERGRMIPSLQTLSLLAKRLEVPISYLLGESEIDLQLLEEFTAWSPIAPESIDQSIEDEAESLLGKVETLIRENKPLPAWNLLGNSTLPPEDWSRNQRVHWYWLAGWTTILLGTPLEAIRLLNQGLRLAEYLRFRASNSEYFHMTKFVERLHCFLGVAYCTLGDSNLALQHHLRCLKAIGQRHITDPELKMLVYKGLGNEYFYFAQYEKAIDYYKQALEQAKDINNKRQYGLTVWGLGLAFQQKGDLFRAKTNYQEALKYLGEAENLLLLAQIRALLGLVHVTLKEFKEAEYQLNKSLGGARKLGDVRTLGIALAHAASLYVAKGETEQAIQAIQEGLPMTQQSGDQRNEANLQLTLAAAHTANHNYLAAEQAIQEAIRLGKLIPDAELLREAHQNYAHFLAKQNRFQEAFDQMQLVKSVDSNERRKVMAFVG